MEACPKLPLREGVLTQNASCFEAYPFGQRVWFWGLDRGSFWRLSFCATLTAWGCSGWDGEWPVGIKDNHLSQEIEALLWAYFGGWETLLWRRSVLPRFHRPREGSHLKQSPSHRTQNQGFASQLQLPPANQPGPRIEMMFSAPFSLSLANSLKVRTVVSGILLSYFSKAQKYYSKREFSAHRPLHREDGVKGRNTLHLRGHC